MHGFQITAIAVLTALAQAQTPAYKGSLLLQPGLSSAKCITAASNSDGAAVTLQTCTGADSQEWTFTGGSVKIFGNKCLDVVDGKNVDGVRLQIWTCGTHSDPNQQFFYTSNYRLSWTNHGKCTDLPGGNLADGTFIQLWTCDGSNPNQVWNTEYSASDLPKTSENDQSGTNACGPGSPQTSRCQTAWINDVGDFCPWAPPTPGTIDDTERIEVAWCTKSGLHSEHNGPTVTGQRIPRRMAVIIAITYKAQDPILMGPLMGSHNGALSMKKFLMKNGYAEEHIRMLLDDGDKNSTNSPTYEYLCGPLLMHGMNDSLFLSIFEDSSIANT